MPAMQPISLDQHRSKKFRTVSVGEEMSFADVEELCAFVAHEIVTAKIKYIRLAEKAGCCPSTVSKLAAGETHLPRASTVLNILRALGFELVARR